MSDEWVMVPRDLLQRVDAALQRHLDRHAPMRIPVDQTDSDLVQSDVQALITAPAEPQQAEPVAWMAFGGSIVHAVTRNAMDPIEAERFDVPLYLHPPAAEVQQLRDAARDVCEWADAAQWALGNETGIPAAKLDALRRALEGGE